MSIERSLVLSNGTTTFTFSLHDHTSESLPLSESVSSSVSSSLVSLSWKKKTDKTRLNGSLNHSQHLHHHHHIHTSSSEDSVALLALYFFCKSEVFLFHTCKQTPSSSSLSSPPPHPHYHHHLLIRRLSCSLGLVLCVTTSLHLCVKLKLLLVQSPRKKQYMPEKILLVSKVCQKNDRYAPHSKER